MITIIHVNLLKVVVVDAGWLGPGRGEDGGNHAGYWELCSSAAVQFIVR